MAIRALLFDLDGTLTDSAPGITRCVAYALEKLGLPPATDARLNDCVGPPLRDSFAALGASAAQIEPAIDAYRERYVDVGILENEVYEGIPALLERLRAGGFALHVATSKPQPYAERILDHFALRAAFGEVYGSRLDGGRSRKTELIGAACGELGLDAAASAMVGDRGVDMSAAVELGLSAIGVRWGYGSDGELRDAGAHALIDAPHALDALLMQRRP